MSAGRRLAFGEAGRGAPVVMLHSGGMSSRQWRRAAEHLAPSYRVLTPDFVGYGDSGEWPEGERFELADEIEATEALVRGLGEPAHLVGHSYGGFVALKVAAASPAAVRSLAVYEPVAFGVLDGWADGKAIAELARDEGGFAGEGGEGAREAFLRRFIDYWSGEGAWDALRPAARDEFRRGAGKLAQEVRGLLADRTPLAAYAAVAAPTLVLSGELSPPDARRVAELIAGAVPGARLERLAAAGHMGPLTHAGAFLRHLEAHFEAAP